MKTQKHLLQLQREDLEIKSQILEEYIKKYKFKEKIKNKDPIFYVNPRFTLNNIKKTQTLPWLSYRQEIISDYSSFNGILLRQMVQKLHERAISKVKLQK